MYAKYVFCMSDVLQLTLVTVTAHLSYREFKGGDFFETQCT